mgnify:CR=1 FL=1
MKIRQLSFIEANRLKEELDKITTFKDDFYYIYLNDSVTEKEHERVIESLERVERRITKQLEDFYLKEYKENHLQYIKTKRNEYTRKQ